MKRRLYMRPVPPAPVFKAEAHEPLRWDGDKTAAKYYGRTIIGVTLDETEFRLTFSDGTGITLTDDTTCCCERRYMSTDDFLGSLIGGVLIRIEEKQVSEAKQPADGDSKYGDHAHDIVFVEVQTNKGFITLVNHNEHNGYYGGFNIAIQEFKV